MLRGDSMGEEGKGEAGEEGDGEREEAWREEGDRLRSMAGGLKQDPGRSRGEDWDSGEEGGDGNVEHSRRGRAMQKGAEIDEGHALFLTGSFKSSGSSNDSMAAGGCCSPL